MIPTLSARQSPPLLLQGEVVGSSSSKKATALNKPDYVPVPGARRGVMRAVTHVAAAAVVLGVLAGCAGFDTRENCGPYPPGPCATMYVNLMLTPR